MEPMDISRNAPEEQQWSSKYHKQLQTKPFTHQYFPMTFIEHLTPSMPSVNCQCFVTVGNVIAFCSIEFNIRSRSI